MPTEKADCVKTHTHQDESSRAREWKQIIGSQIKLWENHLGLYSTLRNNRPNSKPTVPSHQSHCSCQLINHTVWSLLQVSRGRLTPWGLQRGLRWTRPLSQQRITKEHKLSFILLPAGIHKVFHQQPSCTPSHPRCEKLLIEEGKKTSWQTASETLVPLKTRAAKPWFFSPWTTKKTPIRVFLSLCRY